MTTATRIAIPSAIKASIWNLLMNGTPRKRVLEWVLDTASGVTTPVTHAGDQIAIFGANSVDHVSALLDYARNLRPNRKPDAEKARKAKYVAKGAGFALYSVYLKQLKLVWSCHSDVVEVFPTHKAASEIAAGIGTGTGWRVVKLNRVPVGARDLDAADLSNADLAIVE